MPDIIIHFPASWNYYPPFVDHVTPVDQGFLNGIGFAFYSLEYCLGYNPQGGHGTVRQRFEKIESDISNIGFNFSDVFSYGTLSSEETEGPWQLYLPLNEDVKDYSGKGHDGVNFGVQFVAGKIGNCGFFYALQSYYIKFDITPFLHAQEFTLSCWIKPSDAEGAYWVIVACSDYVERGWMLTWNFDVFGHGLRFMFVTAHGGESWVGAESGELTAGSWYHVVCVKKLDSQALYINGVKVKEVSAGIITWKYSGSYPEALYIGRKACGEYFNGYIDHVKYWEAVLSDEEITQEYTSYDVEAVDYPVVKGGNISGSNDHEIWNSICGVVLKSEDGTRWRVRVNDEGELFVLRVVS